MSHFLRKLFFLLLFTIVELNIWLNAKVTSLSDLELVKIIEQQNRLLEQGSNWTEDELTRQAQEIVTCYENFLLENPDDVNALLLFGKFLSKTGLPENAVSLFLQADQINPGLAVVKQALGNFLVEEGKPIQAFPFFLMTIRLAPEEPIYHYDLGNFIFLFQDKLSGIENSEKLGLLMHQSYKEAAKLDPQNFEYHLRFAQSFFDFEHNLQEEALCVWDALHTAFGKRTQKEIDYIKINKARIFLEMNRKQEAILLLRSVNSEAMEKEKGKLLKQALSENKDGFKKSSHLDKHYFHPSSLPSSTNLFPHDYNLRRMKEITIKLRQERMLQDLQNDLVKARILSDGRISLELTYKSSDSGNLK